jgi:hypothetical protein
VTRPQTSPLQSRQERIEKWRNEIKQRRHSNALQARGGLETMAMQYSQSQYQNSMRELEEQGELHATVPEDEDFFEDNDYCHGSSRPSHRELVDEADLLDQLLKQEEEELRYLIEEMSIQETMEDSSDWDIDFNELEESGRKKEFSEQKEQTDSRAS